MQSINLAWICLLVITCACQPASAPAVIRPAAVTPAAVTPILSPTLPPPSPSVTILPASPTPLPVRFTDTPLPNRLTLPPTASPEPVTTLLFTGVIVPARCVQAKLDANSNPDYPYEEVSTVIRQADLAIGTFNATMSDQAQHTGCVNTYQLVGSPNNADALQRAGFDVMSVATNHIKDCGLMKSWCDTTFFDTLANLHRVGILTTGAGKDLGEALQPAVFTVNGVRFGIVSLGDSKMTESVFASENSPGIARLTEVNLKAALAAVRQVSDVVIAMPHWGSEDNLLPNWNQRQQAQQLVAAGADLVVGNHTHVVQAMQSIDGVQVFYGLGNFVFDQGLRDHRQGLILLVKFQGKRYIGYEVIPTHVDADGRVHIASSQEAAEILQRVEQASRTLH